MEYKEVFTNNFFFIKIIFFGKISAKLFKIIYL